MQKLIPFTKAHGTGNDFVILWQPECPYQVSNPDFIQKMCARRTGVGADALLLLSPIDDFDFQMDYYNSDGSWETFCANGARCAALYMMRRGLAGHSIHFRAGDGNHRIEVDSEQDIRLKMTAPFPETDDLNIAGYLGCHINSGAAHFVTPVRDFDESDVEQQARPIRYADCFKPRGVNVNFYELLTPDHLRVLTYEKGIERFMLSCGTGSVAAAFHAAGKNALSSPLRISVPGGEYSLSFSPDWQDVWLSGPAVLLFSTSVTLADLNLMDGLSGD